MLLRHKHSTDETNDIGVCVFYSTIKSLCVSPQLSEPNLLPEVKAQDQGKICVVIDLDETLVHSSFKVINNHLLDHKTSVSFFMSTL